MPLPIWALMAAAAGTKAIGSGIKGIQTNKQLVEYNKNLEKTAKKLEEKGKANELIGNQNAFNNLITMLSMVDGDKLLPQARQMYGQQMTSNLNQRIDADTKASAIRLEKNPTTNSADALWQGLIEGTIGASGDVASLFAMQAMMGG